MILEDKLDYGSDKNGNKRENNQFQNFTATVLSREKKPIKGDIVELLDFNEENSFAVNFDLILRFNSCNILKGGKNEKIV